MAICKRCVLLNYNLNENRTGTFLDDVIRLYEMTSYSNLYCRTSIFELFAYLDIDLDYSLDYGVTWRALYDLCLPYEVHCGVYTPHSRLVSPLYTGGWHRVTFEPPRRARSNLYLLCGRLW